MAAATRLWSTETEDLTGADPESPKQQLIVQPEARFTFKKGLSPAMREEICEGSVAQTTFNIAETMLG